MIEMYVLLGHVLFERCRQPERYMYNELSAQRLAEVRSSVLAGEEDRQGRQGICARQTQT
jgi:hypothetical protein